MLFTSELLGIKFILLTICLTIIMLFNIFYLGYLNSSLMLVIPFYLSLYFIYNSVICLNLVIFKNTTDKNVIYYSLAMGVIIYVGYTFYINSIDISLMNSIKYIYSFLSVNNTFMIGTFIGSLAFMICSFYAVQKLFDLKWDLSG